MPTIIHLQPCSKQHNVERYLKQMKRLLTIATWILPNTLCFSSMSLSEMLFLICISNQCTILKDWISLVSVHVSASTRQTWVILMYPLDNMDLTYVWFSGGYTPQHTGIFRAYLKVMLTMLMYLPTFSLFGPAVWPETWQSLVLSTKFQSEVWVLFKTEFQSEYQSKGKHIQEYVHTENENKV